MSKSLGIQLHSHCVRHHQSRNGRKGESASKETSGALTQETQFPWTKLLPLALIRLRNTNSLSFTSFEALYSRPFPTNDLILDSNIEMSSPSHPSSQSSQGYYQNSGHGFPERNREVPLSFLPKRHSINENCIYKYSIFSLPMGVPILHRFIHNSIHEN